jgi:uncharacterized protein YdeI (YjbR/CyaY-like superfamily)
MPGASDLPVKPFVSQQAFTTWLDKNHAKSAGLWVKIAKKGSGIRSVTAPEALDVALCYGWIDGQRNALDDEFFLQKYTPRRAASRWSKLNCAKAMELIAKGAMKPAGLREVERAKTDGRWDAAYESVRRMQVPDDLAAAFKRNARAKKFFDGLDSRNRYAVLYRIQDAKKPETRARRVAQFVDMLSKGETIYPRR